MVTISKFCIAVVAVVSAVAAVAVAAPPTGPPATSPKPQLKLVVPQNSPCGHTEDGYIMGCKDGLACDKPNDYIQEKRPEYGDNRFCMKYIEEEGVVCNYTQICINGYECVEGKCFDPYAGERQMHLASE